MPSNRIKASENLNGEVLTMQCEVKGESVFFLYIQVQYNLAILQEVISIFMPCPKLRVLYHFDQLLA